MGLGLLWAILAAVATNMAFGMLWYGVIVAKPFMRAMKMDTMNEDELAAAQKEAMPGYFVSMAGAAVATTMLWFLFKWTQGDAVPDYPPILKGIVLAITAFVGFYVGPTLTARFFEEKNFAVWAMGLGYWGILAVLYGVYVGIFA